MFAKKDNKVVHSITSHQREHISVLSCIKAICSKSPLCYIVNGKYFIANHIRGCLPRAVMGVQMRGCQNFSFLEMLVESLGVLHHNTQLDTNSYLWT